MQTRQIEQAIAAQKSLILAQCKHSKTIALVRITMYFQGAQTAQHLFMDGREFGKALAAVAASHN